jgi:hypothetical protein
VERQRAIHHELDEKARNAIMRRLQSMNQRRKQDVKEVGPQPSWRRRV